MANTKAALSQYEKCDLEIRKAGTLMEASHARAGVAVEFLNGNTCITDSRDKVVEAAEKFLISYFSEPID
jgi:hypothetical protein